MAPTTPNTAGHLLKLGFTRGTSSDRVQVHVYGLDRLLRLMWSNKKRGFLEHLGTLLDASKYIFLQSMHVLNNLIHVHGTVLQYTKAFAQDEATLRVQ